MGVKRETKNSYHERINRVLIYIQNHLDEDLRLDELARVACFSPYHFHRVFKGMVGQAVAEYVRSLRLNRAAHLLVNSKESVTDIAFGAGYETLEAFIRAFGARYQMAPGGFREQKYQLNQKFWPPDPPDLNPEIKGVNLMDVKLITQGSVRVAFVRHVGPYDQCHGAWEKLCGWAGAKGLSGPGARFLGLCYDDPEITPSDEINYDACLAVGDDVEPEGEIGVQEIPGGEYAMVVHKGPYEELHKTYAWLCGKWLPDSGLQKEVRHAPSIEVYVNDQALTPPRELVTEVYVPLR